MGGLAAALKWKSAKELSGAEVVIDGAGGRIGRQLLSLCLSNGAKVSVVDRDLHAGVYDVIERHNTESTDHDSLRYNHAKQTAHVISIAQAFAMQVDLFCSAGPPGCFDEEEVKKVNAIIVGGPANDLLKTPSLYRLRTDQNAPFFVPGAVLTAQSVAYPKDAAHRDPEMVWKLAEQTFLEVVSYYRAGMGDLSMYDAMVVAAEMFRGVRRS